MDNISVTGLYGPYIVVLCQYLWKPVNKITEVFKYLVAI